MDKMIKVGRRQRPSGSPRRRPPAPALSPALREEVGSPGKGSAGPRPPPRCSYGCGPAPRCPSVGARLPSGSSPAALRCGAPETGQGKQEVQAGGFQGIRPWGIGVGRLRLRGAEPGLLGAAGSWGLCLRAVPGCGGNAVASIRLPSSCSDAVMKTNLVCGMFVFRVVVEELNRFRISFFMARISV